MQVSSFCHRILRFLSEGVKAALLLHSRFTGSCQQCYFRTF